MKQPGFIGPTYSLRTPNYDCQRTINLFLEQDELGTGKEQEPLALLSVPGQVAIGSMPQGPIRGLHFTAFGYIVCVAGNGIYYLNSFDGGDTWDDPTLIGQLTTSTGPVSIADGIPNMYNGTANTGQINLVIVVDGSNYGIVWEEGTTSPIQLNSGNAFNGASYVTFQDGFFMFTQNVKSPACFFASDPINISSVDIVVANLGPDYISRIISDHDVLWFFGGRSSSVWQNTGGGVGANIFQQIPGSYAEGGCSYPNTIQKVSGQLLWMTSDERGFGMVFQASGYRGMRISNHAVEEWIHGLEDLSKATTWTYQDQGHSFYCLNIPGSETTWCYDLLTKMWSERAFFKEGVFSRDLIENRVTLYGAYKPMHLCSDYYTQKLYTLSNEAYTLDGEPIYRMRTAPHGSAGLKRVFYSQAQIDLETGTGLDGVGYPYFIGYDTTTPHSGTITNQSLDQQIDKFYYTDGHGNHITATSTPTINASGTWSNSFTDHGTYADIHSIDFTVPVSQFGTGTDYQKNYTYVYGGLASGTTISTANIYEHDWRGNILQTTTPQTNLCLNSEKFDANTWAYDGVTILPAVWDEFPTTTINAYRPSASSLISSSGASSVTNPQYVYTSSENTLRTDGTYANTTSDRAHSVYYKWTTWGTGLNKTGTLWFSLDSNANPQGGVSIATSFDSGATWDYRWFTNTPDVFPTTLIGWGSQYSQATPLQMAITIPDLSTFQVEIATLGPQVGGPETPSTAKIYDMCFLTSSNTFSGISQNAPDGVNTGTYITEDKSYGLHGVTTSYQGALNTTATSSIYVQKGDSKRSLELAVTSPILQFTGSITGNQLTVTVAPTNGTLAIGQTIRGAGIYAGTTITAGTSSPYTISWTASTANPIASESMEAFTYALRTIVDKDGNLDEQVGYGIGGIESVGVVFIGSVTGNQLTVESLYSGKLVIGQELIGTGITTGTTITAGTTSPYTLSNTMVNPVNSQIIHVNEGGINSTGIYRIWGTANHTVAGTYNVSLLIYDYTATGLDTYTGSGNARIGIWGMQIQTGAIDKYIKSVSGVSGIDFITTDLTNGTVFFNIAPSLHSVLTWGGIVHGRSINPVIYKATFNYTYYDPIYQYIGLNPQVSLSWSDDGGHTFTPERSVSMGRVGEYLRRCIWRRLGQSRDRVFRVTCREPVKFSLIGAEFKATVGEING
ncbi:MAG: hypothetical protein JHC33_07995 [Ignisphaera sp.]|nr:hypothetical protein [Ignisphaera sp.]